MAAERRAPLPPRLAVITVLKGMIGTGILGLPYVCGKVRLAVAVPGLLGTALLGAFSVWRLIECKAILARTAGAGKSAAGVDAWGLGPLATVGSKTFGAAGVAVAGFGILASQLGFCASYVDVIVETLSEESLLGGLLSTTLLRVLLCAALCLLCLLRQLSSLAWLSGAALLIYAYLLAALLWYGGWALAGRSERDVEEAWLPIRWEHFGAWLGTAIFAQEAIVISQYVYDDMQLDGPWPFLPVLAGSFGISGALFTFVGAFGYLSYGDSVKNVFYLNFPSGSPAVRIGEVVLCLVLVLSFALQMYPVMSFLEAAALGVAPGRVSSDSEQDESGEGSGSGSPGRGEEDSFELNPADGHPVAASRRPTAPASVLRCGAVVLTCLAAAWIPNLACISGYVGCFAMSSIGFFMPALCHIRLRRGRLSRLEWLGDGILLLAGCAAVLFGLSAMSCG